jgi:hypothetical protein
VIKTTMSQVNSAQIETQYFVSCIRAYSNVIKPPLGGLGVKQHLTKS